MHKALRSSSPALMVLLLTGCPAHQGGGGGGYGGGGTYGGGGSAGGAGDAQVQIPFQRLPDAVVEHNNSGVPRNDPMRLHRIFCQDRGADQVIYYQLIVSRHWHYLWLCSSSKPSRISSRWGASRLKRWLRGFKNQAVSNSAGCASPTHTVTLRGSHESGIRAVAYCDGQIILTFPDGGRSVMAFQGSTATVSGGGGYGGAAPAASCPPCRCPRAGSRKCPPARCPAQRPCRCPPQRKCPPKNCSREIMAAGQKGFKQGVAKACRGVCQAIYKKCRSINPKTAMCHMISEHCAEKCGK